MPERIAPIPEGSLAAFPPTLTDIAIVGLGYLRLPLSLQFARSGVNVLGVDVDFETVNALNEGRSYIRHVSAETVADQVKANRLEATTEIGRVEEEVDAVIICVPTPLNKNREPDISYILQTGRAIAPHLRKGTLVVLESRYPGTTDEDLRAVLEAESGFKAGDDFHLAFSPEREDPANPDSKVGRFPSSSAV